MSLRSGVTIDLVMAIVTTVAFSYVLWRIRANKSLPPLRDFPAITAMDEAVGRAVEINKPIHFGTGDYGGLAGERAPMTVACMNLLNYVARACARLGAKLIVRLGDTPHLIGLTDAILKEAYAAEGKPGEYDRAYTLRFFGSIRTAYIMTGTELMETQGVASNMAFGALSTETVTLFGVCRLKGGIGIGGCIRWNMIYGIAMLGDFCLIGDEVYAASAKVSGDQNMVGSMFVTDILKYFTLAILVVLLIAQAAGINWKAW